MKIALIPSLFLIASCASSGPYEPMSTESYFHSWYHGNYLHSVWGVGEVEASSSEAFAICGDQKIQIRPVFDTHMWAGYDPKPGQTIVEALGHNQALLARFAKNGVTCRLPRADETTPN